MTAEITDVVSIEEGRGGITKTCIRGHAYVSPRVPTNRPCARCRADAYAKETAEARLARPSVVERFYEHVTIDDRNKCWPWRGSVDLDGYGRLTVGGAKFGTPKKTVKAHRFSYELNVGPIPEGLTLDHVRARGCTTKTCVNPAHLEPVTFGVNSLRGNGPPAVHARSTVCKRGHEYTQYGRCRICRTCINARAARRRELARGARAS